MLFLLYCLVYDTQSSIYTIAFISVLLSFRYLFKTFYTTIAKEKIFFLNPSKLLAYKSEINKRKAHTFI